MPRHVACSSCREQKVKCDGKTPACSRCQRYGSSCTYAGPNKTSIAHVDSTIQNLSQRLSQAEMALATRNDTAQPSPLASVPPSFDGVDLSAWTWQNNPVSQAPVPEFSTDMIPTTSVLLGQQTEVDPMQAEYLAFDALDPGGMDTILPLDMMNPYTADSYLSPTQNLPTIPNIQQLAATDGNPSTHLQGSVPNDVSGPIFSEAPTPNGQSSSDSNRTSLSSVTFSDLFRYYFDTVNVSYPILDRSKFLSVVEEARLTPEREALKYVVLAHAAALSPDQASMMDNFYQETRRLLEYLEDDTSGGLMTLAAAQTCILVALYELKQAKLARAWSSVSRAVWLCRMLGLHKMDSRENEKTESAQTNHLPETDDAAELEERRATIWVGYTLNCFVAIGYGWVPASNASARNATTLLPIWGGQARNLKLETAQRSSVTRILSPYQGVIVSADFCICCLLHIKKSHRESVAVEDGYDFWTQQHFLKETLDHVRAYALAHLVPEEFVAEPNIISLNLIINATTICLYQAAIAGAAVSKIPLLTSQISQSQNQCIQAIKNLNAVLRGARKESFPKLHPFIPWTIYVPLQVLASDLKRSQKATSEPASASHPRPGSALSAHAPTVGGLSLFEAANSSWSEPQALDVTNFLMHMFSMLKPSNPLASVFEAEITKMLLNEKGPAPDCIIGLIHFPLRQASQPGNAVPDPMVNGF